MSNTTINIEKAYEEMFREHFTALTYFAQKYTGDTDSSKEIVHNVFVNIWEKRDDFDFGKAAKSYLFTSVYNRCMNFLRDGKKLTSRDDESVYIPEEGEYHDTMEVAELDAHIKRALAKLPEKCREVFQLNRFEGKKYAEIAEQLNISVKTVEGQMSKALKILREELKDYLFILWILLFNEW